MKHQYKESTLASANPQHINGSGLIMTSTNYTLLPALK